jgi:subtilisin family serine protease
MFIYDARRRRVQLESIEATLSLRDDGPRLVAHSEQPAQGITAAMRAFFGVRAARGADVERTLRDQGPPALFRERSTGLVRMVRHEIVIRFKKEAAEATRRKILGIHGFQLRARNAFVPDQVVVHQPDRRRAGAQLIDVANDWAALDEVVFATPNFVSQYRRSAGPHPEQWHLENRAAHTGQLRDEDVDALAAWKITRGSPKVAIAVLDDGVDVGHPALKANVKAGGRDFFVPDDTSPEFRDPRPKVFRYPYDDTAGNDIHGTPCAGVAAANGARGGAWGIAPRCKILPIKIFHADGLASDARVADAIRYAAAHAEVLSCSWGGVTSPDIELAVEDIGAARGGRGAPIFCAAGNSYGRPVDAPANHPDAIAVSASTDQGGRASYSNQGPEVWIAAPSDGGVRGIFTVDVSYENRGYNLGRVSAGGRDGLSTNDFGGTSSATPLAAGIGALILSVNPKLDRVELRGLLKESADRIGTGYGSDGHSPRFGYGRVNAARAVAAAKATLPTGRGSGRAPVRKPRKPRKPRKKT